MSSTAAAPAFASLPSSVIEARSTTTAHGDGSSTSAVAFKPSAAEMSALSASLLPHTRRPLGDVIVALFDDLLREVTLDVCVSAHKAWVTHGWTPVAPVVPTGSIHSTSFCPHCDFPAGARTHQLRCVCVSILCRRVRITNQQEGGARQSIQLRELRCKDRCEQIRCSSREMHRQRRTSQQQAGWRRSDRRQKCECSASPRIGGLLHCSHSSAARCFEPR